MVGIGAGIGWRLVLTAAAGVLALVPPAIGLPNHAAAPRAVHSPNWSGYVVLSPHRFAAVVGTWKEPTVRCPDSTGHASVAIWDGLDGYRSRTVEQIGSKTTCVDGTPRYRVWWQMWPKPVHFLAATTYPVVPGDRLTATVRRTGSRYRLRLTNSAGWSFATTRKGTAKAASAEWIVSSPRSCQTCGYDPLARFTPVSFSRTRASTGQGSQAITAYPDIRAVTMRRAGTVRSRPGVIADRRHTFRIRWTHG